MQHLGLVHLRSNPSGMAERRWIAGGNLGTAQTISKMQELVSVGKRDKRFRKLIGELVRNCPPKDYYCYAEQAFLFCRDRIKYVYDPNGFELLEHPWTIIETGIADCDSIVMLLATLCEDMGFPCRFVTIKADTARPDEFSHVFLEVKIPKRGWVGADATQPQHPFGWQPGMEFPRKTWPASLDKSEDAGDTDKMSGLSGMNGVGLSGTMAEVGWFGRIHGLGYEIPGVEDTAGVIVEKPYEFRNEPALITATPEHLELQPLEGREPGLQPGQQQQEFWMPAQVPELADAEQMATAPQMRVQSVAGLGADMKGIPTWVWAVGGIVLVMWLMKRR